MLVTPKEFTSFLCDNGSQFPYKDCRVTRSRFHVRWLLIKQHKEKHLRAIFPWKAISSRTFENDTVTHLIVTKQAIPLPPDMSEIMDTMAVWGEKYDVEWHHRVVDYLAFLCTDNHQFDRQHLFHHCLEYMIDLMLQKRFGYLPMPQINAFMDVWEECFHDEYKYGNRGFRHLCYFCFNHALRLIEYQGIPEITDEPPATVASSDSDVVNSS